jgi:hypothetical protein
VGITPPSDIVLGSMLAADPDKYRAAVERLRQFAADRPPPTVAAAPAAPVALAPRAAVSAARRPAASDAFGQLEAFVLQTFIENMLPSNAEVAFGKGTAGAVWKSMLAEQLAKQMALSGQVGLARRLAEGFEGRALPAGEASRAPAIAAFGAGALPPALPYLQGHLIDVLKNEETASIP